MSDAPPLLQVRSASFGYAGRTIVSGVDLTLDTGDSAALLGPNGCGKSTLVKGLLGLNEHLGGQVLVQGRPLNSPRQRRQIGYVPQRHTLSNSVVTTVGEVVTIGRLPHLGLLGRPRRRDREIVAQCLETVGLSGLARTPVAHLSGGQQRRVLVARALAAQPRILIMDEPTAGVDESNQRILSEAMQRLIADGVAVLTVTHELDALGPAVNRAVVMQSGRIVADGTPREIIGDTSAGRQHHHLPPAEYPAAGLAALDLGGRPNA